MSTITATISGDGAYAVMPSSNIRYKSFAYALKQKKLSKITCDLTLSTVRSFINATNVGQYAVFAGGIFGSRAYSNEVEAIHSNLTKTNATTLSVNKSNMGNATIGNYALFAGGQGYNNNAQFNTVEVFDSNLTKTSGTGIGVNSANLAGASSSKYAAFAGGSRFGTSNGDSITIANSFIRFYNTSLAASSGTSLSQARWGLAGASVNNYIIFAGGTSTDSSYQSIFYNTVDAYDINMTKITSPSTLSSNTAYLGGASTGKYAIFAGGMSTDNSALRTIAAYDTNLTKTTSFSAGPQGYYMGSTSLNDHAIFSIGASKVGLNYRPSANLIFAYDDNLLRSTASLSEARFGSYGASIDNKYVVFAGGAAALENFNLVGNTYLASIDIFTLE